MNTTMRTLFGLPRGFNAEGRMLGLGLAAAMERQRAETAREVEDYLRHTSDELRHTSDERDPAGRS
jgi:hypothetical protein